MSFDMKTEIDRLNLELARQVVDLDERNARLVALLAVNAHRYMLATAGMREISPRSPPAVYGETMSDEFELSSLHNRVLRLVRISSRNWDRRAIDQQSTERP